MKIYCTDKKQNFLKAIQQRVRLGASHYLYMAVPCEKFIPLLPKLADKFHLNLNPLQRTRRKNNALLPVANCFCLLTGRTVFIYILFTLPDSFVNSVNFKKAFKEQAQYLNDSFNPSRVDEYYSIYDKKNRLTIFSSDGSVPVYVLNCLELPERLKRQGKSHQWVFRLHPSFIKGKTKKMLSIVEKARNIKKGAQREHLRNKQFLLLQKELDLLKLTVPIWGIQDDVTSISKVINKAVKKSSLDFQVDVYHQTYKGYYFPEMPLNIFTKKIKALSNG